MDLTLKHRIAKCGVALMVSRVPAANYSSYSGTSIRALSLFPIRHRSSRCDRRLLLRKLSLRKKRFRKSSRHSDGKTRRHSSCPPKYRRLYLFDVRFKFTNVRKETTVSRTHFHCAIPT